MKTDQKNRAHLFVGGPADGMRIEADGESEIKLPVLPRCKPPTYGAMPASISETAAEYARYTPRRFTCGSVVYAIESMDSESVIGVLISGYNAAK